MEAELLIYLVSVSHPNLIFLLKKSPHAFCIPGCEEKYDDKEEEEDGPLEQEKDNHNSQEQKCEEAENKDPCEQEEAEDKEEHYEQDVNNK